MDRQDFGYLLRDARLKAGRTLDDIARRTKIPVSTLERLEEGNRQALPAEVFVCGFLRAYARELGLDAEEVVGRYRLTPKPTCDDPEPEIDAEAEIVRHAIQRTPKTVAHEPQLGLVTRWSAKLQMLLDGDATPGVVSRGPSFALVVLLVVLVATITLSLLLGGDPRPGRGLS